MFNSNIFQCQFYFISYQMFKARGNENPVETTGWEQIRAETRSDMTEGNQFEQIHICYCPEFWFKSNTVGFTHYHFKMAGLGV